VLLRWVIEIYDERRYGRAKGDAPAQLALPRRVRPGAGGRVMSTQLQEVSWPAMDQEDMLARLQQIAIGLAALAD